MDKQGISCGINRAQKNFQYQFHTIIFAPPYPAVNNSVTLVWRNHLEFFKRISKIEHGDY
ncbi:MAG: hypothetical protein B7Y11_04825 [Sphingobacteriia bacterium 24-36-13]|nr:MAG: hypothetical protein B7Y11_04825 [Sphingobacteriia bacterium 24-36-13]